MPMRKPLIQAVTVVAAGIIFLGGAFGNAQAPQTPAAGSQPVPAAKPAPAPAAKAAQTPAANSTAPGRTALTTDKEKDSYAVGLNIGRSLKKQPVDIDTPSLLRGVKDALAGSTPLLTDAEIDAALKQLSSQVQAKQDAEMAKMGEANMKEGEDFLAANKTKDGVVTLPSGLQYKIVTAGTGAKPTAKDTVVCNYRGTFINGTEFDSSYKRGQPASFPVGGVIKGWTEALQLMPVGSKWQLFVPPDLAYGQRGAGGAIGPNQTLIFDVELISIKGQ
ncbi:MAG TPA: FKBP-type peptidyl-prolyl cis-trans isomerase [Candidatus Acidoferrales bacterium]|nr:FKBP-type peptidyl-prolyl cis-trans isomerase [Candidatus Acidoferrales bacterium]